MFSFQCILKQQEPPSLGTVIRVNGRGVRVEGKMRLKKETRKKVKTDKTSYVNIFEVITMVILRLFSTAYNEIKG